MVLADIKATFDDKTTDRLSSVAICETLAAMEGRPWAEWKAGKPITPNQLAGLLKPFGIIPDSVRVGDKTPKGYYRHQFEEVWRRYLTPQGVREAQQGNNPDEIRTFAASQSATRQLNVAVQKYEKPSSNGHCCGVATQNEGKATRVCAQCGGYDDGTLQPHHRSNSRVIGNGQRIWLHPECVRFWKANGTAIATSESDDGLEIPNFLRREMGTFEPTAPPDPSSWGDRIPTTVLPKDSATVKETRE
jgi:hypothetical protein